MKTIEFKFNHGANTITEDLGLTNEKLNEPIEKFIKIGEEIKTTSKMVEKMLNEFSKEELAIIIMAYAMP